MISADQLLSGRKYRDVDVVTVTPSSLSARVDGRLVEVDLEAKPQLCAEVRAIAPGASRLRIAQASLESVRADELNPGLAEAWLVVADPKPGLDVDGTPRALVAPAMSLLSAMPRAVSRYASGLTADEIAMWPNLCAIIDEVVSDGGQSSSRNGAGVNAFQVHHSTMRSARAYIDMVRGLLRQVSSNLAIDDDGRIFRVVSLLRRAWTSGSASFDAAAITVETANETLAPDYRISTRAKAALARVARAIKLDRAIQKLTSAHVYLHREMLPRWGVSYSTACLMDTTAAAIIRDAEALGGSVDSSSTAARLLMAGGLG
ncbi:peptidoglycan recognition protein family protein [Pseudoclavibacter helvolus]|uniref:peptidoglycan recognition protein family protein n=1 Tax=Pseudoclavibacter helvolus TaxID=255205 RepID=UPI0037365D4F